MFLRQPMLRPVFRLARSPKLALQPGSQVLPSAASQVNKRSFCVDVPSGMDMKDGIKAVTAALSALKYGPQAVQKIMAMGGSGSPGAWPAGKKVKIVFQEMNAGKEVANFWWRPEKQHLYEVFMKLQAAIGNRSVLQGRRWREMAVRCHEGRYCGVPCCHNQHPSPKLQVEWRPRTAVEVIQSKVQDAKFWLTGGAVTTDQAVKEAQDQVEKKGGKIAVSSGSGRSLIDHRGYRKAEWPAAVEGLKAELELSEQETETLLNAARRDEGRAKHFREKISGNRMIAQYMAYHTVCHEDKIDVVYGKHEESMEVTGEVAALPRENCIEYNGVLFAAWPPASPHSRELGSDMRNLLLELPAGWKLVDSTQEGFDNIRRRLIAPYGWHAYELVTSGEGQLEGWWTALSGDRAGESYPPAGIARKGETQFQFTGCRARLLIQAHPSANHELVNNWKRFVQLSAQREWSQRLGMLPGSTQESP